MPPSPRHPKTRWQVRYQDGNRERSAGIYPSPKAAKAVKRQIEQGILPSPILTPTLDADAVGRWKARLVAAKLAPQTINTFVALLATILNAAVDSDYLPRSPLMRKSGAGRIKAAKREPVPRRGVWLTRDQLDRLAEEITPRYRALVLMAALTGMRSGSLPRYAGRTPSTTRP